MRLDGADMIKSTNFWNEKAKPMFSVCVSVIPASWIRVVSYLAPLLFLLSQARCSHPQRNPTTIISIPRSLWRSCTRPSSIFHTASDNINLTCSVTCNAAGAQPHSQAPTKPHSQAHTRPHSQAPTKPFTIRILLCNVVIILNLNFGPLWSWVYNNPPLLFL